MKQEKPLYKRNRTQIDRKNKHENNDKIKDTTIENKN